MLQPLIPADLINKRAKSQSVIDHLVTTFYGPVYLFTSMMMTKTSIHQPTKNKKLSKKQVRTVFFVSVSHFLLDLHRRFGMVLPILNVMEQTVPSMYRLLTPDDSDLDRYSAITWMNRPDVSKPVKTDKGWSNFPTFL